MRTSFSSNSQLAHIWASQTQEHGKANNMFFRGDSIYSYGTHYKVAKFHQNKAVLIKSRGYSNATAKHTSNVRGAVTHLRSFHVPNVDDATASENIQYLANHVVNSVQRLLNCVKVSTHGYELQNIKDSTDKFNAFCAVFNIDDRIDLDEEFLAELELVYQAKLARTKELDATRAERDEAKRLKAEKEYVESVRAWKNFNGQIKGYSNQVFLRINRDKNIVETSRGASVPLDKALDLVKLVETKKPVQGLMIGSFTVNNVTETHLVIGCHTIPLEEMRKVFSAEA